MTTPIDQTRAAAVALLSSRPTEDPALSTAVRGPGETQSAEELAPSEGVGDATASTALKKSFRLPDVPLRELSIRVSPETNRMVIEVIDSETKTVVRKIPSDEALDLLRHLESGRALLVDRQG